MKFQSSVPHFEHLKRKWTSKHDDVTKAFFDKHQDTLRQLTLGGLGGMLLLTTQGTNFVSHQTTIVDDQKIAKAEDKNMLLAAALKKEVPEEVRKLTGEEEEKITQILSSELGMSVKSELEGIRLNRSYGLIGGEQHLYRYPGDNLYKHAESAADWSMFGSSGIAPGLGAWGYFAPTEAQFTSQDQERERYYLAVQTFLAPGFAENFGRFRDFFKYRKMLVVNPLTGQVVVAVVGDAGPAEWTGKHLGGSPEVMHFVGLATGPRKGPVLYFFIDDPDNKIPLGPIKLGEANA